MSKKYSNIDDFDDGMPIDYTTQLNTDRAPLPKVSIALENSRRIGKLIPSLQAQESQLYDLIDIVNRVAKDIKLMVTHDQFQCLLRDQEQMLYNSLNQRFKHDFEDVERKLILKADLQEVSKMLIQKVDRKAVLGLENKICELEEYVKNFVLAQLEDKFEKFKRLIDRKFSQIPTDQNTGPDEDMVRQIQELQDSLKEITQKVEILRSELSASLKMVNKAIEKQLKCVNKDIDDRFNQLTEKIQKSGSEIRAEVDLKIDNFIKQFKVEQKSVETHCTTPDLVPVTVVYVEEQELKDVTNEFESKLEGQRQALNQLEQKIQNLSVVPVKEEFDWKAFQDQIRQQMNQLENRLTQQITKLSVVPAAPVDSPQLLHRLSELENYIKHIRNEHDQLRKSRVEFERTVLSENQQMRSQQKQLESTQSEFRQLFNEVKLMSYSHIAPLIDNVFNIRKENEALYRLLTRASKGESLRGNSPPFNIPDQSKDQQRNFNGFDVSAHMPYKPRYKNKYERETKLVVNPQTLLDFNNSMMQSIDRADSVHGTSSLAKQSHLELSGLYNTSRETIDEKEVQVQSQVRLKPIKFQESVQSSTKARRDSKRRPMTQEAFDLSNFSGDRRKVEAHFQRLFKHKQEISINSSIQQQSQQSPRKTVKLITMTSPRQNQQPEQIPTSSSFDRKPAVLKTFPHIQ